MKKIYDLSQPLNQDVQNWPFYPPFEAKYFKRKSEQGVNAQYIQTSNHIGTHLDAPRHFVTKGRTIDQIPLDWLYGDGVIVDISAEMDELEIFSPELLESKAEIRDGDILVIHTGWHKFSQFGSDPNEEKYILRHPGPHFKIVDWLVDKKIKIWGVDMVSTDHPMNLPIGRFLGKGGLEQWKTVTDQCTAKFGQEKMEELFPNKAYQLTHNALFPHDCIHVENMGGDIDLPELHNRRITIGIFPWLFKGGEAAFCRAVAWLDR